MITESPATTAIASMQATYVNYSDDGYIINETESGRVPVPRSHPPSHSTSISSSAVAIREPGSPVNRAASCCIQPSLLADRVRCGGHSSMAQTVLRDEPGTGHIPHYGAEEDGYALLFSNPLRHQLDDRSPHPLRQRLPRRPASPPIPPARRARWRSLAPPGKLARGTDPLYRCPQPSRVRMHVDLRRRH